MLAYIYLHTHTRSYRRESDDDRHTHTHTYTHPYTHPCLPLILRAHKHTHTSRGASFIALPGALYDTHTHTSSCVLEICLMMTRTYTHPYPRLIALHNTFLFHVYRSVSLARMRRYTQLAYLFYQCTTGHLSRDCRIADCTVRHPGVERPFSSLLLAVEIRFFSNWRWESLTPLHLCITLKHILNY